MISTLLLLSQTHDAELAPPDVPIATTLFFAAILVAVIVCLALEEKLHAKKSLIVAVFASICLFLGSIMLDLPFGPYKIGDHLIPIPEYITTIDWSVIAIILGASLFIDVVSRSGLFTWIAVRLTKVSRGDPVRLLWFYGVMTVAFSAVLNNVTAMIIVGSLTGVSLGKLGSKDKLLGFLLIEGLLTNVGGLLTLISSVPNIIVGTTAKISFMAFFIKAAPFVVIATVVTIVMGAWLFGIKRLVTDEEKAEAARLVAGFDENDGIESVAFFWLSAVALTLFILIIATTSVIPHISQLGMGFVALSFATFILIRYKATVDGFYQGIDWDLLAFFAGLFMIINVMEHARVLALIGNGLTWVIDLGPTLGTGAVLVSAAGFSSVTDNIPLSAMLAKIISGLPGPEGAVRTGSDPLWWSVIFGANLGGNITPIGSASTLVAVTIIHKYEIKLSFAAFVVKAIPYALVQIGLATVYVLVVLG